MGMKLDLATKVLNEEEYSKLKSNEYLINSYDLSIKSIEDFDKEYKALFFDIIAAMPIKDSTGLLTLYIRTNEKEDLYHFFLRTWRDLVEELNLDLDNDLFDYISLEDWLDYEDENEESIVKRTLTHTDSHWILTQCRYW